MDRWTWEVYDHCQTHQKTQLNITESAGHSYTCILNIDNVITTCMQSKHSPVMPQEDGRTDLNWRTDGPQLEDGRARVGGQVTQFSDNHCLILTRQSFRSSVTVNGSGEAQIKYVC